MKLTQAARNAVAFAHIVGRMPKYLHSNTWQAVFQCLEGSPSSYKATAECMSIVDAHKLTAAVRKLEAEGWRIDTRAKHVKVRQGITLIRDSPDDIGRTQETTVYTTGKQGRIYSR